jgi:hypothetical protein
MLAAQHHGVVKRERREGVIYWSLGDGVPLVPAPDADEDPEMKSRIVLTPAAAATTNDKLSKRPEKAIKTGEIPQPAPDPDTEPCPIQIKPILPPPEPVFGAFSDGSLSIDHGGTFLRLGAKHAQALQAFMNRAWERK